ncbi:MAG: hypothetical protein HZB55_11240 [Deltaproteobacteria bacterium]|nr:hypothetical protein [Deltaproteobacteria bacterium]
MKALADPALNPNTVNTAWVQSVWSRLDPEWVRKFCLGGQEGRIQSIAQASPVARQALYEEFCRQHHVPAMLEAGGDFKDLGDLPDFTVELKEAVTEFLGRCYKLFSDNAGRRWNGYELNSSRSITNRAYKDDFCSDYPTKVVCPYCDGEIGTPELDHYLYKSGFPLLACSPWNLIPVCGSCNDVVTGKGSRPAITLGPPRSTDNWLHPFARPASDEVTIRLTGAPQNSIPQLHSLDAAEQIRLSNHTDLIRSLSRRWTRIAAASFDVLVAEVNRNQTAANSLDSLVRMKLEDHLGSRRKAGSSMVHAAVCQAVLDRRPQYLDEFTAPNAPALA